MQQAQTYVGTPYYMSPEICQVRCFCQELQFAN
jgi:hypothetical protein